MITIEAAEADLKGELPLVAVDGWNVNVAAWQSTAVSVALNENAQVNHWSDTGLLVVPSTYVHNRPAADGYKIKCAGDDVNGFTADDCYHGGNAGGLKPDPIDISASQAGPEILYQTERWGDCTYIFPMKPLPAGKKYIVCLHFAETTFNDVGKRRFNVVINGKKVLSDLDVFQEAGGKDRALVKSFAGITPDPNGKIFIKFESGSADKPEINAIEITKTESSRTLSASL